MKKAGVIANPNKKRAVQVLEKMAAKAKSLSLSLVADKETARMVPGLIKASDSWYRNVDVVIALGGDGTMLRVVRMLGRQDRPVMGLNLGGLGFLTSVSESEMETALESIVAGKCSVSTRTMLESVVNRGGRKISLRNSLNDVVITTGQSSRVLTLDVAIDSEHVTSYMCDGLIVATPSGSTAHSLSAGGPIIMPDAEAFVLSIICPHSLSSRPIVIPDESTVCVRVTKAAGKPRLTTDGQISELLEHGDCVVIRKNRKKVRFLHLPSHSYFGILRQKLHWSGSSLRSASS